MSISSYSYYKRIVKVSDFHLLTHNERTVVEFVFDGPIFVRSMIKVYTIIYEHFLLCTLNTC